MEEKIEELKKLISELKSNNITFEELGNNNFQKADAFKNEFSNYCLTILDDSIIYHSKINISILSKAINDINTVLGHISSITSKIQKLVKNGIHTPEFPNSRESSISGIKGQYENLLGLLFPLQFNIDIIKMQNEIQQLDPTETSKKIEDELVSIKSQKKEIDKILTVLRDKTSEQFINESKNVFNSLTKIHKESEKKWFILFWITIVIFISELIFIYFNILNNFDSSKVYEIISKVLFNSFILGLLTSISRFSLSKFNAERLLRVTYEHRSVILEQYKTFELSIGDNDILKNQLRLDIAKYIFTDPKVSFSDKNINPEINFSPIFQILEKLK
ncbi:hypothetical protein LPTSP3_g31180 [Leptospira kobayashii]|uniref:Uncharacterized protein n=1 Tax=Leptospira kobayashii TaxID=1917830 RepID=A0ABM7UMA9_9LEPT|nr:hypothetical protein [Leptospira kobayashii]BDA80188.1 hypothetical protein LPTSP3_g31180 [Leptospira kobayashii]